MKINKLVNKIKNSLYKFLGKFIPYFKNKIMGFINKDEISEKLRMLIEGILKRNDSKATLTKYENNNEPIKLDGGGYEKDKFGNEGLDCIIRYKVSYKINYFNQNLVLELKYSEDSLTFIFKDFPSHLFNNENIAFFNDDKFKNEIIDYIKSIRTIS